MQDLRNDMNASNLLDLYEKGSDEELTSGANLDLFRKMVSNKAGKKENKGYVRWVQGSNGRCSIEKFNNKIDVSLSWRSRTLEKDYKKVRKMFFFAMTEDLSQLAANTGELKEKTNVTFKSLPAEVREAIKKTMTAINDQIESTEFLKIGKDSLDIEGKGKLQAFPRKMLKKMLDTYDSLKVQVENAKKIYDRKLELNKAMKCAMDAIGMKVVASKVIVNGNEQEVEENIIEKMWAPLDMDRMIDQYNKDGGNPPLEKGYQNYLRISMSDPTKLALTDKQFSKLTTLIFKAKDEFIAKYCDKNTGIESRINQLINTKIKENLRVDIGDISDEKSAQESMRWLNLFNDRIDRNYLSKNGLSFGQQYKKIIEKDLNGNYTCPAYEMYLFEKTMEHEMNNVMMEMSLLDSLTVILSKTIEKELNPESSGPDKDIIEKTFQRYKTFMDKHYIEDAVLSDKSEYLSTFEDLEKVLKENNIAVKIDEILAHSLKHFFKTIYPEEIRREIKKYENQSAEEILKNMMDYASTYKLYSVLDNFMINAANGLKRIYTAKSSTIKKGNGNQINDTLFAKSHSTLKQKLKELNVTSGDENNDLLSSYKISHDATEADEFLKLVVDSYVDKLQGNRTRPDYEEQMKDSASKASQLAENTVVGAVQIMKGNHDGSISLAQLYSQMDQYVNKEIVIKENQFFDKEMLFANTFPRYINLRNERFLNTEKNKYDSIEVNLQMKSDPEKCKLFLKHVAEVTSKFTTDSNLKKQFGNFQKGLNRELENLKTYLKTQNNVSSGEKKNIENRIDFFKKLNFESDQVTSCIQEAVTKYLSQANYLRTGEDNFVAGRLQLGEYLLNEFEALKDQILNRVLDVEDGGSALELYAKRTSILNQYFSVHPGEVEMREMPVVKNRLYRLAVNATINDSHNKGILKDLGQLQGKVLQNFHMEVLKLKEREKEFEKELIENIKDDVAGNMIFGLGNVQATIRTDVENAKYAANNLSAQIGRDSMFDDIPRTEENIHAVLDRYKTMGEAEQEKVIESVTGSLVEYYQQEKLPEIRRRFYHSPEKFEKETGIFFSKMKGSERVFNQEFFAVDGVDGQELGLNNVLSTRMENYYKWYNDKKSMENVRNEVVEALYKRATVPQTVSAGELNEKMLEIQDVYTPSNPEGFKAFLGQLVDRELKETWSSWKVDGLLLHGSIKNDRDTHLAMERTMAKQVLDQNPAKFSEQFKDYVDNYKKVGDSNWEGPFKDVEDYLRSARKVNEGGKDKSVYSVYLGTNLGPKEIRLNTKTVMDVAQIYVSAMNVAKQKLAETSPEALKNGFDILKVYNEALENNRAILSENDLRGKTLKDYTEQTFLSERIYNAKTGVVAHISDTTWIHFLEKEIFQDILNGQDVPGQDLGEIKDYNKVFRETVNASDEPNAQKGLTKNQKNYIFGYGSGRIIQLALEYLHKAKLDFAKEEDRNTVMRFCQHLIEGALYGCEQINNDSAKIELAEKMLKQTTMPGSNSPIFRNRESYMNNPELKEMILKHLEAPKEGSPNYEAYQKWESSYLEYSIEEEFARLYVGQQDGTVFTIEEYNKHFGGETVNPQERGETAVNTRMEEARKEFVTLSDPEALSLSIEQYLENHRTNLIEQTVERYARYAEEKRPEILKAIGVQENGMDEALKAKVEQEIQYLTHQFRDQLTETVKEIGNPNAQNEFVKQYNEQVLFKHSAQHAEDCSAFVHTHFNSEILGTSFSDDALFKVIWQEVANDMLFNELHRNLLKETTESVFANDKDFDTLMFNPLNPKDLKGNKMEPADVSDMHQKIAGGYKKLTTTIDQMSYAIMMDNFSAHESLARNMVKAELYKSFMTDIRTMDELKQKKESIRATYTERLRELAKQLKPIFQNRMQLQKKFEDVQTAIQKCKLTNLDNLVEGVTFGAINQEAKKAGNNKYQDALDTMSQSYITSRDIENNIQNFFETLYTKATEPIAVSYDVEPAEAMKKLKQKEDERMSTINYNLVLLNTSSLEIQETLIQRIREEHKTEYKTIEPLVEKMKARR